MHLVQMEPATHKNNMIPYLTHPALPKPCTWLHLNERLGASPFMRTNIHSSMVQAQRGPWLCSLPTLRPPPHTSWGWFLVQGKCRLPCPLQALHMLAFEWMLGRIPFYAPKCPCFPQVPPTRPARGKIQVGSSGRWVHLFPGCWDLQSGLSACSQRTFSNSYWGGLFLARNHYTSPV